MEHATDWSALGDIHKTTFETVCMEDDPKCGLFLRVERRKTGGFCDFPGKLKYGAEKN